MTHSARTTIRTVRAIVACIGAGGLCGCGAVRIAPAPVELRPEVDSGRVAPPRGHRFYTGKAVGSEAQFNPFSLVINGGFDQLRTANANREVFTLDYERASRGVWRSMTQPDRVINSYGLERWVKRQLLPLSGKASGGGQWVPNYQLHLFAGGMTGVRITEWYQQNGTPNPEIAAAATVATWHFITEMIENQSDIPRADAMTDLLLFDPAAFLIWRSDRVQRLFSRRVEMTNWPGQPIIAAPTTTIQNMHQTTMLRAKLWQDYRPMTTFGGSFLLGLSRRVGQTDWLSLAGGWDPTENPVTDPVTGEKTVTLNPNLGAFYDRDGSLLAAIYVRVNRRELVTLNVYPGVVHFGRWAPGLFAHVLNDGRFRLGIVPKLGLGSGVE